MKIKKPRVFVVDQYGIKIGEIVHDNQSIMKGRFIHVSFVKQCVKDFISHAISWRQAKLGFTHKEEITWADEHMKQNLWAAKEVARLLKWQTSVISND